MKHTIYETRKEKVKALLSAHNLDIILLHSSFNETGYSMWIDGVKCHSAYHYFYITPDTRGYIEIGYMIPELSTQTEEKIEELDDENTIVDFLPDFLKGKKRIGVVGSAPFGHFVDLDAKIVNMTAAVDMMVVEKSDEELAIIQRNADLLTSILDMVRDMAKPGVNQMEIAKMVSAEIFGKAEKMSFPLNLVSGHAIANTTIGKPKNITLREKDVLAMDFGAYANGFYSDCTRIFPINNPEAEADFERLVDAHYRVVAELHTGMTLQEVLDSYNKHLKALDLPYESLEVGYLGHSIGFFLHEQPFIYQPSSKDFKLIDRMVFTLEPEIYFPNYHLRIEDMIMMKDGKPVVMTGTEHKKYLK